MTRCTRVKENFLEEKKSNLRLLDILTIPGTDQITSYIRYVRTFSELPYNAILYKSISSSYCMREKYFLLVNHLIYIYICICLKLL